MRAVSLKVICLFMVELQTIRLVTSANILAFYPFPGLSHHKVCWPLLRELAVRGHNVTMVSPFSMANPPKNYREIKVPDYSEECLKLETDSTVNNASGILRFLKSSHIFNIREMGLYLTERILQDSTVQWLIDSNSTFHIIMGEFSFVEESFIALAHRFQASYVEVNSFGNYHWADWLYGNALDTSYMVDFSMPYDDKMSFLERMHNSIFSVSYRLLWHYYYIPKYQSLADTYIRYTGWQKRPSISNMMSSHTSMYLFNTHNSLNYPYPLASHYKEIGGINLELESGQENLPQDILEFMDGADNGVIYFSMGSYLVGSTAIKPEARDAFISVFSGLKQRVLWKWEQSIPNLPSNILIKDWMPQSSILSHPKCRLFISHGGYLSLTETIDRGVPVVTISVFADQHRNSKFASSKGIGVNLDFNHLTRESISMALNEILENPSYKETILKQSKIYRDKPETALETAVYWTEYVIRHNGAHHLRPAVATMPWYNQAMLDVYAALAVLILTPIFIMCKLICYFRKLICRGGNKKSAYKEKSH